MQTAYWSSNLKHLRLRKGVSQDALAETLNISRSKLNAHENGKTVNPPVVDLMRFSDYYRISIDVLIRQDLSKLSELKLRELEAGNDAYARGTKIRVLATTVNADNDDNAEFVPVKAKAGYTAGYGDPDFISSLPHFSLPQLPKNRKHRMFPTTGDSMSPVPEGAYVVGEYVEDWKSLKERTPCVVVTREEGIVFKLVTPRTGKTSKALLLESLNSIYAGYEVALADVLELWCFKGYLSETMPEAEAPMEEVARAVWEIRADVKKLVRRK